MVLKRQLRGEGGGDGSEFPSLEPKRRHVVGSIGWDLIKGPSQELVQKLEPLLRSWVREEVEGVISSYLRSSHDQIGSSESSAWQLHFDDNIPPTLFTGSRIESQVNKTVKIVLCGANSQEIIASGPLSSLKLEIVVLDGNFSPDDREDWTEQEFNNSIVLAREGKRPLVTGDLVVQLRDGVGYTGDICFTDNSSWIRGRSFRLGAKVQTVSAGVRIREAVSAKFIVKDHRGESYKKHYPPSLSDEVWRLDKIAKDGTTHLRLAHHGITTVKTLLQMLVTNPVSLRDILGGGISEKKWKTITEHAISCNLDSNELYLYRAAEGTGIVFNAIFKVVGAIFDGQNYQCLDKLSIVQQQMVDKLKHRAYANTQDLVLLDGSFVIGCPMVLSSPQANSFNGPGLGSQNVNCTVQQDLVEVQMNSGHATISPLHTYQVDQNHSMQDSFSRMWVSDSRFRNTFSLTDADCGLNNYGYRWDPTGSMGPLTVSDLPALGDNIQFKASAMQEHGLFPAPTNQAIHVMSSDLDIHISSNRKPKVRWGKIRAVIKWRVLVKQKYLREWQDFFM